MAETSDRMSSLAARYARIEAEELTALGTNPVSAGRTAAEIRSLAMLALRFDRHKGLRGLIRKVTGL